VLPGCPGNLIDFSRLIRHRKTESTPRVSRMSVAARFVSAPVIR